MGFVFDKCKGKKSCLISPEDIISFLLPQYELSSSEVAEIIDGLILDDYISVINSDKRGKLIYCISLRQKGEAFQREKVGKKKTAMWLLVRTLILALISFAFGLVLKAIFS